MIIRYTAVDESASKKPCRLTDIREGDKVKLRVRMIPGAKTFRIVNECANGTYATVAGKFSPESKLIERMHFFTISNVKFTFFRNSGQEEKDLDEYSYLTVWKDCEDGQLFLGRSTDSDTVLKGFMMDTWRIIRMDGIEIYGLK